MKKGISVQTVLSIALALIFIIAAALIIHLLFPYSTHGQCIKGQRLHIEEINSTVEDAKIHGATYVLKFRVEDCVECMWYDDSFQGLKVRWIGMSITDEPVIIGVSVPWIIGDNDPITDDLTCSDVPNKNLKGGTTCVFEINYNRVVRLPDTC